MTVEVQQPLNSVDLEAVGGLVAAVRADAQKAKTTWAAHVRWQGGFRSEARVRGFAPTPRTSRPRSAAGTARPIRWNNC